MFAASSMSSMPRFLFLLPGFYCATPGLADVTNPCKNGSFCPTGSIVPDPFECTIGFHCPLGSSKPKPCPAGSFTNSSGRDQCDPCPEGFYCFPLELARNESIGYRVCPRGYYCPQGTGLDWRSCPAGTYSDRLGLYKESQCQDCDAGKFCDGRNLTSPTDFCAAGYFCTIGKCLKYKYGSFSNDVMPATVVDQNKEMGAMWVEQVILGELNSILMQIIPFISLNQLT